MDGAVRGGWALRGMPRSAPSPRPPPARGGGAGCYCCCSPSPCGRGPGEGAAGHTIYELNEAALAIARSLGSRLSTHPGAALFLDYGPEHSAPGDSLQAVSDGRPADPLAPPGTADLTAHVDFAAFAAAARSAGAAISWPGSSGPLSRSPRSVPAHRPLGADSATRPRLCLDRGGAPSRRAEQNGPIVQGYGAVQPRLPDASWVRRLTPWTTSRTAAKSLPCR